MATSASTSAFGNTSRQVRLSSTTTSTATFRSSLRRFIKVLGHLTITSCMIGLWCVTGFMSMMCSSMTVSMTVLAFGVIVFQIRTQSGDLLDTGHHTVDH